MEEKILAILKVDLGVSSTSLDTYLTSLIDASKQYISEEGITIGDQDALLIEMYAAYLYRKRREQNTSMPRMLRWALNNRLFSEKGVIQNG